VPPETAQPSICQPILESKMIRKILIAASVMSLAASPVFAAPCHDGKGKFIKCATAAPSKPVRCKGANGKFAKCGTPGAKPV
jgi:hypothetical protein